MSETIVFIHGYAFDERIWLPVELAFDGFHTVYLNLPGFGPDPVKGTYTISQLAKSFWDHPEISRAEKIHLIGHSMGGYVSIEMVSQQPSRVVSLALIHSHVFKDSDEKKAGRQAVLDEIKVKGHAPFVSRLIPSLFAEKYKSSPIVDLLMRRGMEYSEAAWYAGTDAMLNRNDHSHTLTNITSPVLMVAGEKDMAAPLDFFYKMAGLTERARLHVYPDTGHMSMYENTAQLIGDLRNFYSTYFLL